MTAINMIMVFLSVASIAVIVVRDKAVGDRFPMSRALSLLTLVCIASAIWLQLYWPLWSIPVPIIGDLHPEGSLYVEVTFDVLVFTVLFILHSRSAVAEGLIEAHPQPPGAAMSLGELKSLVGTTSDSLVMPADKLTKERVRIVVIAFVITIAIAVVILVLVTMSPAWFYVARILSNGILAWLTPVEYSGIFALSVFCTIHILWHSILYKQRILTWR
jgi:hypothetical protein